MNRNSFFSRPAYKSEPLYTPQYDLRGSIHARRMRHQLIRAPRPKVVLPKGPARTIATKGIAAMLRDEASKMKQHHEEQLNPRPPSVIGRLAMDQAKNLEAVKALANPNGNNNAITAPANPTLLTEKSIPATATKTSTTQTVGQKLNALANGLVKRKSRAASNRVPTDLFRPQALLAARGKNIQRPTNVVGPINQTSLGISKPAQNPTDNIAANPVLKRMCTVAQDDNAPKTLAAQKAMPQPLLRPTKRARLEDDSAARPGNASTYTNPQVKPSNASIAGNGATQPLPATGNGRLPKRPAPQNDNTQPLQQPAKKPRLQAAPAPRIQNAGSTNGAQAKPSPASTAQKGNPKLTSPSKQPTPTATPAPQVQKPSDKNLQVKPMQTPTAQKDKVQSISPPKQTDSQTAPVPRVEKVNLDKNLQATPPQSTGQKDKAKSTSPPKEPTPTATSAPQVQTSGIEKTHQEKPGRISTAPEDNPKSTTPPKQTKPQSTPIPRAEKTNINKNAQAKPSRATTTQKPKAKSASPSKLSTPKATPTLQVQNPDSDKNTQAKPSQTSAVPKGRAKSMSPRKEAPRVKNTNNGKSSRAKQPTTPAQQNDKTQLTSPPEQTNTEATSTNIGETMQVESSEDLAPQKEKTQSSSKPAKKISLQAALKRHKVRRNRFILD